MDSTRHLRESPFARKTPTGPEPRDPEFDPDRAVLPLTVAELRVWQGGAGPGLVEWFLAPDSGCAFVLLPGEPLFVVRLPDIGQKQASEQAAAWFKDYGAANADEAKLFQKHTELAATKFARWGEALPEKLRAAAAVALWPVLNAINAKIVASGRSLERLVFCPHDFLHLFPLHAAPLREASNDELVIDRWEITYAPSLSLLHRVAQWPAPAGEPLLVGNMTQDLLFTELESALFTGRNPAAATLYGGQATPEAFLASAADKALLHASGHMTAAGLDARQAGLVLAGQQVLRLPTLYARLKLARGGLVLLNGCESGMLLRGEGGSWDYEGLPMAFLFAGARNVVSTLWTVYDLSSALLLDRFHHERRQPGATVSGALRAAAN